MKTFVINLERREDRLKELNIPFPYERFIATDGHLREDVHIKMKGHLGCRDSHLRLLKDIHKRQLPYALVLEDDVTLAENFLDEVEKYMKELPEDWDILYLGGWGDTRPYSDHLKRAMSVLTTHAYIVRDKFLPTLIEEISKKEHKIDVLFCRAVAKANGFIANPVLAWQKEGYSDILNTITTNKHTRPMNKPTFEEVNSIDLSPLYKFVTPGNKNYLEGDAGVEHYKLLGWFSQQFDHSTIVEIGTLSGFGLIALSLNDKNKVVSYDIRDFQWKNDVPENCERKIVHDGYMDDVVKSPIIFYDAAHEGKEEQEFLDELIARNWHGILVLDDIHLNPQMEEFWGKITQKKEDWSDLGHQTGTGVVFL